MSTIYTLEPPTVGKVVLVTTAGEIEIELWSKEAPKACRNFVQLCLERYYDNVVFHRVIKDFMVQTGDPTGTGEGGESVYGEEFQDEFHSRLHFNHRGQVAMANQNKANTNASQFFITLDKCPWLDKKHTIFGKVAGTTIYNCIKMGELECIESTDRPAEPPRILRCDVVWNPFEDIVPRNLRPQGADVVLVDNAAELGGAKKRKNLALLSFGDDEVVEEEDAQAPPPKRAGKSIHDVVEDDARLVKAGTADEEQVKAQLDAEWEREQAARAVRSKLAGPSVEGEPDDGGDFEARMKRKIQEKRKELLDAAGLPPPPPPPPLPPPPAAAPRDVVDKEARRREKEEATKRAEAEKLHRLGLTKLAAESGLYSAGETKRREIKYRKDAIAERERETLAKLSRFQESLHSKPHAEPVAPESAAGADGDADEREGGIGLTRFRSEGLYYDDDDDDKDWRGHALHFKPTGGSAKSFAPSTDDYVVLDPLLEKGKAAFLKSKEAKRKTEWAGRSRT